MSQSEKSGPPQTTGVLLWVLLLGVVAFNVWYDFRDPLSHPIGIPIDAAG